MNKQRRLETWEAIETFNKIRGAWTMEFEGEDEGWWAYYEDEKPLGPFATEAEAARAELKAWGKETAPGG
jgi:hypothetical protein